MDVDSVADELYGLPPDEFTSARDARAAEARSAGNRDLATAIRKLRRPTAGAWLANLLVRERGEQIAELLDLGAAMRQAQADLAGGDLRRLAQQRRQVVAALGDEAKRLGRDLGRPVSEASARDLEATLEAAVADPGAAEALRRGRLETALRYAGFGPVDLTGSGAVTTEPAGETGPLPAQETASPPAGRRRAAERRPRAQRRQPVRPDRSQADQRSGERLQAARRELRAAEATATEAERGAAKHERRLRDARTERDRLHRQVGDLERRLRDLRDAEDQAERDMLDASAARDAADLKVRGARDRVTRARTALDQLTAPGA